MLKFLKIILGFVAFIALVLLINLSFFGVNKITNNINFNNYTFSGSLVHNINYLDNIYSKNKKDFEVIENENGIEINLKSGVFILDLNDITKKYKIKGNGFELDVKGAGDIYIDSNLTKNLIFSLNSSFSLNFLDKNKETINSYFMYPHEWIRFNSKLNFIYKKSDLYRIRTTTKNGYIKESFSIFKKNKIIFEDFLGKENILLFENYIYNKKEIYKQNNLIYKKVSLLKNRKFPFSNFINKYRKYFINDNKKGSFLQNNIYNDLVFLLKENKKDKEIISKIHKNLEELKSIDLIKYNEINLFIKNIYKVFLLKNNINSVYKLNNLLILINKDISDFYIRNYFKLHKIYYNYDFLELNNFIVHFNLFLKTYLNTNLVTLKNEDFKLNNKIKLIEIESFVFYLREYINSYLFLKNFKNFSSQVDILSKYTHLDEKIYFNDTNNNQKIKTSLKQNIDLLSRLEYFLRNIFFENKRDKYNNLLILSKTSKIKYDDLKNFENSIFDIFSLFEKNKNYFDSKSDYERLYNLIKEEFLAIKDYQKYKLKYEKELQNIYSVKGVGEKQKKIYYINDIYLYFSQFNGFSFEKKNITKKGDFFEINSVFINNKKYKLEVFPYMGNKVDIYDFNTNKYLLSYDLDKNKKLLLEKYKGAKAEEKYKYDFTNFFNEKFKGIVQNNNSASIEKICALKNLIPDPNSIDGCIEREIDSDVISVFKKNKLLNEEFIIIADFADIKYENIDVKYIGKVYKIKLNNIKIKIDVNKVKYELLFNSDYDFKNHEFYNINLKIKKGNSNDNFLFGGKSINLGNRVMNIKNLKKNLRFYLRSLNDI